MDRVDTIRVAAEVPARAGVGFKATYADTILRERPALDWIEVHPENYMVEGGPRLALLDELRVRYPLSLHGVALSLGDAGGVDARHLARLRTLVDRFEPGLVSEHLAWSSQGGLYLADLLPLPLSCESLSVVCAGVMRAQEALDRRILVENPAHYLAVPGSEIPELEFLTEIARRTGCGLLLDVNNVFVSAHNLGFDAAAYLDAVPGECVEEIHLAGHSADAGKGSNLLIDSHGAPVAREVWALFERLIRRIGPRPTLVERDNALPEWGELLAEVQAADARLARVAARDEAA